VVPADFPLHHQVVAGEPLGEGNSVFLSLSPAWDQGRAPAGRRALTISTHTRPGPWWELLKRDRSAYQDRKDQYADRMLGLAGAALPGLRRAAEPILAGTPVTFQRYTGRAAGWVGGFPQSSLLRAQAPRLGPGLWQVGDSIFPGQSTAAVALGGLRVARDILDELGLELLSDWTARSASRPIPATDRLGAA
jgi:phytoene dehydrogenase-like protein